MAKVENLTIKERDESQQLSLQNLSHFHGTWVRPSSFLELVKKAHICIQMDPEIIGIEHEMYN